MPKNIEQEVQEEEKLVEGTPASDTLRPQSRAGMMANVMTAMNGMSKSDLIAFFQASMDQFGPGKSSAGVPDGAASKNMASIATKEDLDEVFTDDETLTEDTKTKISTLFEAQVSLKVQERIAQLEEEFETRLNEAITESETSLAEKVDEYLTVAANEWLKENELAVENGIRSEILESFMSGLKTLFQAHNIDIPESQTDALAELQLKVEELEVKLDESLTENVKLKSTIAEEKAAAERAKVLESTIAGLDQTSVSKFKTLAESISFTSTEDFGKKLNVIKEQYFSGSTKKPVLTEEVMGVAPLVTEEAEQIQASSDPAVASVVQALSKLKR